MTTYWVGPTDHPSSDVGVFVYRCRLVLDAVPDLLTIDVSADQRYKLYVNGHMVAHGPQRGDLNQWFYDCVDIQPYLHEGDNDVRAVVWNFGWLAPIAQMSLRTGFVCRSSRAELNTPGDWECARLDSWSFARLAGKNNHFYMEVGPGEIMDSREPGALDEDLSWKSVFVISDWRDAGSRYESLWAMTPRSIPPMRRENRLSQTTVRSGDYNLQLGSLTLDYHELLCAYPVFVLAGEPGVTVTLTYDEGLWETSEEFGAYGLQAVKGHRDVITGKEPRGYQDKVVLSGQPCTFEPLWWRTYRYITIEADGPSRLESVSAIETGYPYQVESTFETNVPNLDSIWRTSIRTLERCAGETYFDCPYYEQLQYAGDTRLQVLSHYYLSSDRRLARNAIQQLGNSLQANGLTQSRFPNRTTQFIPPFSLWWILMLHDQMLYDGEAIPDDATLRISRLALEAFAELQRAELSGKVQHWMFADWVPGWDAGIPPGGANSTIHHLTRQLAEVAMSKMAGEDLQFTSLHFKDAGLIRSAGDPDWRPTEHAEALSRLLQAAKGQKPDPWPTEELRAASAYETSLYFSYYKHLAVDPSEYLAQLGPWREMIEAGLTTFAETPEPARSDCHAWSAHPVLGFFQIVAGISSSAARWERARVVPHPGDLARFHARVVHPRGEIVVRWEDQKLVLETPVPTEFSWRGKSSLLDPGSHSFPG